jgi:hypothetical protein
MPRNLKQGSVRAHQLCGKALFAHPPCATVVAPRPKRSNMGSNRKHRRGQRQRRASDAPARRSASSSRTPWGLGDQQTITTIVLKHGKVSRVERQVTF